MIFLLNLPLFLNEELVHTIIHRRQLCRVLIKIFISCTSYSDVARQNAVGGSLQPNISGARDYPVIQYHNPTTNIYYIKQSLSDLNVTGLFSDNCPLFCCSFGAGALQHTWFVVAHKLICIFVFLLVQVIYQIKKCAARCLRAICGWNIRRYSRTPDERPPSPTTIPLIRPHFV